MTGPAGDGPAATPNRVPRRRQGHGCHGRAAGHHAHPHAHPPQHQAASNRQRSGAKGGAGQEFGLTVRESGQGVGAVYRQGGRGSGGRRIAADYRVTAYQPATLLAFKTIAGPPRATGEFRLQEAAGAMTLTMSLGADLAGVKRCSRRAWSKRRWTPRWRRPPTTLSASWSPKRWIVRPAHPPCSATIAGSSNAWGGSLKSRMKPVRAAGSASVVLGQRAGVGCPRWRGPLLRRSICMPAGAVG